MPPAIETHDLTKIYRSSWFGSKVKALDSLNLHVESGEIFGFLGANGAGKTTTVKLLLRLSFPTAGEAYLLGKKIPHTPTRARIGYLPENPYFYDFATPEELLRIYAEVFGLSGRDNERRIDVALERVRMTCWRKTSLRNFSKGMVQRIGIAQALLNDPDLLLLDEPTSGLDPVGRAEMRDLILDLKAQGKTVFLNSHLLSEIEAICDRVAILRRGRLVRHGKLDDLLVHRGTEIQAQGVSPELAERLALKHEVRYCWGHLTALTDDPRTIRPMIEALYAEDATVTGVVAQRQSLEELFLEIEGEADDEEVRGGIRGRTRQEGEV